MSNGSDNESPRSLIPIGVYPAVLVPTTGDDGTHLLRFAKSGEKGDGSLQCVGYFKITRGRYAGRNVIWFGYMTEGSYERTMKSWRYCGWKGADINNPGPMNQEVEIEVEHNEWNGKVSARVAWVNPPGGGAIQLKNPVVGQERAKVAARIRGAANRFPEVAGRAVDVNAIVPGEGDDQADEPEEFEDRQARRGDQRQAGWTDDRQTPPPTDDGWGQRGGGGGYQPTGGQGQPGGPDDDIPFVSVDLGADRVTRRWDRWP